MKPVVVYEAVRVAIIRDGASNRLGVGGVWKMTTMTRTDVRDETGAKLSDEVIYRRDRTLQRTPERRHEIGKGRGTLWIGTLGVVSTDDDF